MVWVDFRAQTLFVDPRRVSEGAFHDQTAHSIRRVTPCSRYSRAFVPGHVSFSPRGVGGDVSRAVEGGRHREEAGDGGLEPDGDGRQSGGGEPEEQHELLRVGVGPRVPPLEHRAEQARRARTSRQHRSVRREEGS